MRDHPWVLAALAVIVVGGAAQTWARTAAPQRYRVLSKEARTYSIANGRGTASLMLDASTGATAASLTLVALRPGTEVAEHVHEQSAELLYIQDGVADLRIAGQKLRVGRGDAVYIPAGAKHSVEVVSEVALRAVQVYAGPGPEQRFTEGPRVDGTSR
jgi:mannose-6-phosphate isomerase-like protein (cupin superfamily)